MSIFIFNYPGTHLPEGPDFWPQSRDYLLIKEQTRSTVSAFTFKGRANSFEAFVRFGMLRCLDSA